MYEGQVLTTVETLVVVQCYKCHCLFAMPSDMKRRCKEDNSIEFFCPAGHGQIYSKSDYQRAQEKITQLENKTIRLSSTIDEKNHVITQLNYSVRAQKAAKTKIMNRVKNGVCPCCNRTFKDLQNHFKTKHSELFEVQTKN